jgi:hypothetical protein
MNYMKIFFSPKQIVLLALMAICAGACIVYGVSIFFEEHAGKGWRIPDNQVLVYKYKREGKEDGTAILQRSLSTGEWEWVYEGGWKYEGCKYPMDMKGCKELYIFYSFHDAMKE